MNTCSLPTNDNDIEGIRNYLIWSMTNVGMSTKTLSLVDILYQKIQQQNQKRCNAAALAGYAITCRKSNRREWMNGLADYINEYCKSINDSDRFEFNGDGIVKI